MKIAFISQPLDRVLPPSQNSIGIWIYEVARRLAQDHEVHVFSNGGLKPRKTRVVDGVHYHYIQAEPYAMMQTFQSAISRFLPADKPFYSSWLFSLGYALQAAVRIRRLQADMVHIVNFSQFVTTTRLFNPQASIILHMQCEWLSQLDRRMIASRLRETNMIIGCSEYITQKVRDRFQGFASRCHTVFNGVDETSFFPLKGPKSPAPARLLFVSRLSPEKGVHVLIRAFTQVCKHHPDTQLHLIGSGGSAPYEYIVKMSSDRQVAELAQFYTAVPYKNQLLNLIPPQLTSQVFFHGHMDREKITEHFHNADILINPSISEPFGMALVEGMASGIPVIAPAVGGMVEIIDDGVTGYITKPGDPDDLAQAILRLVQNQPLRAAIGKAGRQRVLDEFSWDRIVERLLCHYEKVHNQSTNPVHAETLS